MTAPGRPGAAVRLAVGGCVLGAAVFVSPPCACGPRGGAAALADDVGATARARQWSLRALRVSDAWRRSRGEGVLVAVLDTGVNPRHPDLAGTVTQGPDLTGGRSGIRHWGHHGTSMASIVAGRGHGRNRLSGVLGVAPAAEILSVRVTLENDDPLREVRRRGTDALARGIRYAADHGADVISMSLGGGSGAWEGSAAEEEAVQYALDAGAVLVASAGNDGDTANRKNFPAAYPGVIAVGAVDDRFQVAPFSNRQSYLSVVAPGTQIVSADGGRSYVLGDGTSSAAAMVAGIAALIRAEYPDLSPLQVRRAIERGTVRRPASGHDPGYGHGVVNAVLALREAARVQCAHSRVRCGSTGPLRAPAVAAPAPYPGPDPGPAPGTRRPAPPSHAAPARGGTARPRATPRPADLAQNAQDAQDAAAPPVAPARPRGPGPAVPGDAPAPPTALDAAAAGGLSFGGGPAHRPGDFRLLAAGLLALLAAGAATGPATRRLLRRRAVRGAHRAPGQGAT
ncbi:hypothetical protein Misp01_80360 [Microtetraspora sp. NBRC 13810]|uniref:S8 family serine peptidase n=1 Tax=Microtetraspora sp. NBRC 13810 TaxID=3030990 RepID=UPI0024A414D1|nr:S8 family serine peptidase [Microtetraspora sp. NBRC 13810]GLW12908.1 hypothetical protein Misp01_80360 [Microtetraspora sp. NBRC 13810]